MGSTKQKKKLTGEELKRFLLNSAAGFVAGGLTYSLCGDDLLFLGLCLALAGLGWLIFKKDLKTSVKTSETPEVLPFDHNRQL